MLPLVEFELGFAEAAGVGIPSAMTGWRVDGRVARYVVAPCWAVGRAGARENRTRM